MVAVNLMIELVSGVIGGNAAGSALRRGGARTGTHTLLGSMGAVCCAQLLGLGGPESAPLDLASMAAHTAGGMTGGFALVLVYSLFQMRRAAAKPARYRTS